MPDCDVRAASSCTQFPKPSRRTRGYKAVSAVPSVKDAHPTADITLMKGSDSKTVPEQLD